MVIVCRFCFFFDKFQILFFVLLSSSFLLTQTSHLEKCGGAPIKSLARFSLSSLRALSFLLKVRVSLLYFLSV